MSDSSSYNWRPETLVSERLIIRAIAEGDAASVFAYASNPNVTRFTLWDYHKSLEETMEFLKHGIGSYVEKAPDPMAICMQEHPDVVIGLIGCRWAMRKNQCMEMGYAIGEPHWGRGIAVEAGRAVIDYAFGKFEVERIQAHTMAENSASTRVLEKLGMVKEGTARSALLHRGRFWDLHYFSILRGEWIAKAP